MKRLLLIALIISAVILAGCSKTGTKTPTGNFIKTEAEETPTKSYINTCTDSEDGINERVKGTVTGMLNGVKYEIEDKCIRKDYVIDYYCEGDVYKNKNFVCQCLDGACHD